MQAAALHPHEAKRLASLHALKVLDTDAEQAYDELVQLAASIAGTEIALVSLVDADRQWFKARFGLAAEQTDRSSAFCAHAILTPDVPFVVENTLEDLRFADNPLVLGGPNIRFYAGVPLRSPVDNMPLGTLCAISPRPMSLAPVQICQLKMLARQVERLFALRTANHELVARAEKLDAARRLAEQATAAKSRFLATVSHDMRTPLTGVLGALSLIDTEQLSPSHQDLLTTATASANVLRNLVNDTLDLAKIESGTLTLARTPFSPYDLIDDTLRVVKPQFRGSLVKLVDDINTTTEPSLKGDPARIQQILLNLLGNAVKFTRVGQIRLRSWAEDGQWCLAVDDTGPGIPAAEQEVIFEPFMQAEPGLKKRGSGAGLGLSICRRLVDQMGGTLNVESEVGVGSSFFIKLPLPVGKLQLAGEASTAELVPLRILLAEDNATSRHLIRLQLQRLGMEATAVPDGDEALSALRTQSFDLALLDLHMPGLTGPQVARHYRADYPDSDLPIVALTASTWQEQLDECLDAGMNEIANKPLAPPDLRRLLGRAARGEICAMSVFHPEPTRIAG